MSSAVLTFSQGTKPAKSQNAQNKAQTRILHGLLLAGAGTMALSTIYSPLVIVLFPIAFVFFAVAHSFTGAHERLDQIHT